MSRDWYRDHSLSPEASSDEEYRDWAYQGGAHIDLAGNVVWPDQPHPDHHPVPGFLTCTTCGLPSGDPKCPACPTCGAHDCTEDDETDLSSCPYFQTMTKPDAERGTCSFGCRDEPRCITCEPMNGWPSQRIANV